jgi:predicted dehydrogenase
MTLRVGLLGCGRIAQFFHGPILGARPDVLVTALADPVAENRRRLAGAAPGANHHDDWRLPIDLGEVDAVVICLPPALHAPAALHALAAGCHVYVEKPLALTPAEGRAVVAAWRRAGSTGMTGLNFRFNPLLRDARARIAAGELGEVAAVRMLFTSARRTLPGWKTEPGAGGDALADLATHDLDLAGWLLGSPILPASLRAEQVAGPHGAMAVVAARHANGALLSLTAGQVTGQSARRIEVLGARGHLVVDLAQARPRPLDTPPGRFARLQRAAAALRGLAPAELLRRPGAEPSLAAALGHFVAAARAGRPATPDLADGLAALDLVAAAQASAQAVAAEAAR